MSDIKNPLSFIEYKVNTINFKRNSNCEDNKFEIAPIIEVSFFKSDDEQNTFKVIINCNIFKPENENENNTPFYVQIELEGIFVVNKKEDADFLIKYNAVATLLPYVRALIAQVTSLAGYSALNIPMINVMNMYNDESTEVNEKNES